MTSPDHDRPRGHADTAAEYLTAAGDGIYFASLPNREDADPARQVAALQGIGWALLAVCDQLADLADAVTGVQDQVGDVAAAVQCPGKSALMHRFLAAFVRRHPGAEVCVLDLEDTGAEGRWPGGYARKS